MKIGFCGTGGTGKTTTARLIQPKVPERFLPSLQREVFREKGLTEEKQKAMTPVEIWHLQREMFVKKIQQDVSNRNALFDRTPVDNLAYCLYRCSQTITDTELSWLEEEAKTYTEDYDLIFYFPLIKWEVPDDGLREQGFAYRATIDAIILGYLQKFKVDYFYVPEGDQLARAHGIMRVIEGKRREGTHGGEP